MSLQETTETAPETGTESATETTASAPTAAPPAVGPVRVTEKAAGEIKRIIEEKQMPPETVLRVGVAGGGCSGFQYSFGFDQSADPTADHVSEQHGFKVAVDKKSALFLDGTTVDFYDGLDKRGFTFDNPNAQNSCGCGSSFSA